MKEIFEDTFPIDVGSRSIDYMQKAITFGIKILAFLMTLVILWSIIDVAVDIYYKMLNPPYAILNLEDILGTFGGFLIVLIAIEIFLNIILYLRQDVSHMKLVIATALMAIARKIIILDYDHVSAYHMLAMGVIILTLGIAYWLVSHPRKKNHIVDNSSN